MTIAHLVYIPVLLAVGFYVGWSLGARSIRNEWARAEKRRREREDSE